MALFPLRKADKNNSDSGNKKKPKQPLLMVHKASAAVEAIKNDNTLDSISRHSERARSTSAGTTTTTTATLKNGTTFGRGTINDINTNINNKCKSIPDTNSDATSFSEGQFAFSSTSRSLNIRFANKVKESRKEIESLAIKNKLEQQGINLNKLNTSSDTLVGRDEEVQILRSVFEKTVVPSRKTTPQQHYNNNNNNKNSKNNDTVSSSISKNHNKNDKTTKRSAIVSISGISGTGKTVLAKQLKEPTLQKGGFFCLGKFDLKNSTAQQQQKQNNNNNNNKQRRRAAQPYRAFMAASHDLAEQILECEAKILKQRQQQEQLNTTTTTTIMESSDSSILSKDTTTTTTTTTTTKNNYNNKNKSKSSKGNYKYYKQQHPLGAKIEQAVGQQGVRLLLEIFPGLTRVLRGLSDQTKQIQTGIEQKTSQLTFVVTQLFRVLTRYGSHYDGSDDDDDDDVGGGSFSTHSRTTIPIPKESSSSSSSSSQFYPVVLVLDDVQWADQQSLNLAQAIWTDPKTSFMLIVTSRSDEMTLDHPFEVKLREAERTGDAVVANNNHLNNDDDHRSTTSAVVSSSVQKKQIRVERIFTENLTEEAVQTVVANALRDTEEYVKGLADVVFEKTLGNAYFVGEFLQMLVNDGLLTYNLGMMKWFWEEGKIQALSVADNVGSLLSKRIEGLSDSTRALMKIAAILGQVFEEDLLSIAMMSLVRAKLMDITSIGEIREACEQCIESGLLEQSGSQYTFVHDQIQATAFKLIPSKDLASMQLAVGQGLLKHRLPARKKDLYQHYSISPEGDDDVDGDAFEDNVLFLAVDLCNSGSSELDDRGKTKLAAPNRRAASKAIQRSAFDAAIAYAKSGISYLEETTETTTEKTKLLKLKLHTIVAEASFCIGDTPSTEEYAQKVIDSNFSFDEKYVGYLTKMLSEFSNDRMNDATKTALYILRELGFFKDVPRNPGIFRVMKEIVKTKYAMKKYTEEQLLDLPPMTDEKRFRAINIIYRITNVLFSSNPNLFLVLALTSTRWTVKYGISKYSPPIFAVYGMVVCGVLEDFEHGTMIGDVALALSEKLQANQTIAMTTQVTFAFITHWKNDIRAARKPMEYGLQTGFQMGDVNNAIANLIALDQNSLLSGHHNLSDLEVIMRESVAKIRSYGQESFASEHSITWQFVLNLLGKADNPLVLTGEAMDQEKAIEKAKATDHKLVLAAVSSFGGLLGYLYENPEFAVSSMKVVKKEDCIGYVIMPRHFSFLALAYVGKALQGKRPKHNLKKCRRLLTMLKKWVAFGNINIRHFITLIEAEIAALTAPNKAAPLYEEAIKLGGRIGGFRHDKATAHARAARFFFVVRNDDHWGSYHLDKAIEGYCEWGAVGVAQHLAKIYMEGPSSSRRFTFSNEIDMSKHMSEILTTSQREHPDGARSTEMDWERP